MKDENEQYLRKLRGMFGSGGAYRPDTPVDDIVADTLRRAGIDPASPDAASEEGEEGRDT